MNSTRSNKQATILVVDDEEDLADIYTMYLNEVYTVQTAYSGDEALEAMNPDIDVVLLDRRMPGQSGSEVLRQIRNWGYDCPIVFITAVEPDIEILSMDFDEYLTKPISPNDLQEVVEAMLAREEHETIVRDAIVLVSKMVTLEAKMDIRDLEESEEYAEAQRRFNEVREKIEAPPNEGLYSELVQEKLQLLFE